MEIGGYFELENFSGTELHVDAYAMNYGRFALEHLLTLRGDNTIWLPTYICDSVTEICIRKGICIHWYNIDESLKPIFRSEMKKAVVLVVNYFGCLSESDILGFKKKVGHLIVDNTQAFFAKHMENVDTIYSCRKFFGVPDGAYLYTTSVMEKSMCQGKSLQMMKHILGRYEETATDYFGEYQRTEDDISNGKPERMSKLTHNLMRAIDYESVERKRTENYNFLDSRLQSYNQIQVKCTSVPFMYPFWSNASGYIRQELIRNKIYIPRFWKEVKSHEGVSEFEQMLVDDLLPLPCDQRYSTREMKIVVNIISSYFIK